MTTVGRVMTLCVILISVIIIPVYSVNIKEKNRISKCCPESSVLTVSKLTYVCDNAPENVTLDFSDVDIYKYNVEKTKFKADQIFQINYTAEVKTYRRSELYKLQYFLTEDILLILQKLPNAVDRWKEVGRDSFCLDYEMTQSKKNKTRFKPVFIVTETQDAPFNINEYYIKIGALLVSCLFLLVILLVYCLLSELRNLAGKVMMAYAGSLLCAYGLLATLLISFLLPDKRHITKTFCVAVSSAIYFFFMATFLWMNVMSWDLWYSFRRLLDFRRPSRSVGPYTFFFYCAYAFGIAFGMVLVFVLLNEYPLPGVITPGIPDRGCFIAEPEKMLYFYVPMIILISCNWIFFLLTAYNFWQFDRENKILNRRNSSPQANATRQRFIMYIKFSILMGVSFILEAVSSKAPELSVWYITDMYNMLIGVAFFVILVCKRRILRKILKKFNFCGNSEGFRNTNSNSKGGNTNGSKSFIYHSTRPEQ